MIFLDTIYRSWLNPFEDDESCLELASRQLVQQMNLALDLEEYCKVWKHYDRLFGISLDAGGINECAEIHLWCARAQYLMCNFREAARLYREVISKSPPKAHQLGVAQWLLGYVLWQIPGEKENAIKSWERSKTTFEAILRDNRYIPAKKRVWYQEKCGQIKDNLGEAIANRAVFINRHTLELKNGCASNLCIIKDVNDYENKPPNPEELEVLLRITRQLDVLKVPHHVYNVYEQIGRIQIINDTTFKLFQVDVDDLVNAGIEKNDYVIFKTQDHARDDEIILVYDIDDDLLTLKLYVWRGNPKLETRFRILGKAVAMLKKSIQPFPQERDFDKGGNGKEKPDSDLDPGLASQPAPIDDSLQPDVLSHVDDAQNGDRQTFSFEELYRRLINMARGDANLVNRLIEHEKNQQPSGDRKTWIEAAIVRWELDYRTHKG